MYLIFSTSLHPESRSRILARAARDAFADNGDEVELIDLVEVELPLCDGASCYQHPEVQRLASLIEAADGAIIATPIYNYNIGGSLKNLIELTGKSWTEKIVGLVCAAGGHGSYMSLMGIANSLMLDFRTWIVPRFVYTTGADFQGNEIADPDVHRRLRVLVDELTRASRVLLP